VTTTSTQQGESRARQPAPASESRGRQHLCPQPAQVDAILAQVGHELACSLDTADSVVPVCRLTVEALRCDYGCLLLWQPREAAYVPVGCHGVRDEHWDTLRLLKLSRAVMRDFIERLERETVLQVRAALVGTTPSVPLQLKYGASASIHTVLRRGAETIGVLVAGYRHRPEGFTPQHERIARGIAQLAGMTLETAERMHEVQRASVLKSELVATVSHELRTPLNIILGYNDLLLEHAYGPLTPRQRTTLHYVEKSAHELLDLINAILDLSRLENGRIALNLRETDIGAVLHEIDAETQPLREKAGLTFVCRVPPSLAPLRTDPTQLKVLLKNLIVNALKFTDRGSVTVAVDRCDGGVEISVTDTGIGMAPQTLSLIFEPFHQVDRLQQRRCGGVGLGLFIVRRILELLGGAICVESTVGCGSTFRVWLPNTMQPPAGPCGSDSWSPRHQDPCMSAGAA
jgi:signal transduction histidine kinase